jgi:hypothetical protein
MSRRGLRLAPLVAALFPVAVLANGIQGIDVLSNRADVISGGDALVAVRLSTGVDPAAVKMTLNGHDVTGMFAVRQNGQYAAVVTGLVEGDNELRARMPDGSGHEITIRNHPIGGPVFSGEQVQPWLCRTHLQNNPALGAAIDEQCNAPTVVEYFYRNLSNQFVTYNPASPPAPEQIQQATTDQGKTVPFIVQRVTGTANRGIYQFAVLVDPTKPIEPWSTEQPWNGKLYNSFGGACSVNYQQPTVGNVLSAANATRLGLGFAVATSSLNTYGNQCNDIISAEALMMTKEIITERHGPIRYTIGDGGSAGTMQQHLIAETYPGLLNGLMTSLTYEDHWYQVVSSFDCIVLWRAFGLSNAVLGLTGPVNPLFATAAERQKVWGSNPANPDNLCGSKIGFTIAELIANSTSGCAGPPNPADDPWRWHPVTNPDGTRCTIQDYQKAMFGVGADGKAPRPLDNVGVQYGLNALLAGTLSAEQFVDINHRIGGLDIDGVWQPQRTEADLGALATLYRTGRIVSGRGAALVAEIDNRSNFNSTDFHPPFHSWTYRARLDRTNGNHDGQVIWVPNGGQAPNQFLSVDAWLAAVEADTSDDPLPVKIARNKPDTVFDACFRPGGVVLQDNLFCEGNGTWQYYGSPRLVAGWPFTNDAFKCQLKPLDPADYPVSFTEEQWARLQQAFPTGVCDWTKPAVAEQPSLPWISFAGGPGGEPLGDAPASALVPVSVRLMEQAELVGNAVGTSYVDQLASVQAYYEQGDTAAACGALDAYLNHVRAQSGRRLSTALANDLQFYATSIGSQIGCW